MLWRKKYLTSICCVKIEEGNQRRTRGAMGVYEELKKMVVSDGQCLTLEEQSNLRLCADIIDKVRRSVSLRKKRIYDAAKIFAGEDVLIRRFFKEDEEAVVVFEMQKECFFKQEHVDYLPYFLLKSPVERVFSKVEVLSDRVWKLYKITYCFEKTSFREGEKVKLKLME
jgi:hypothetical protein